MSQQKKSIIAWVSIAIIFVVVLAMCSSGGSSSSSSGRKWSDLSETEKQNARWAYEVQQSINGN